MKTNKQPTINRYLLDNKTSSRTLQITSFAPLLEKPARLVARVTDDTSVQRRYRAAWRPNKQFPSTIPKRFTTARHRDTKQHTFGERILTAIITLLVVIFSTLHSSHSSRAIFQAGSLLLCLGTVYILLNSILYYTYILDTILLLIRMATCSTDCLEVLLQHFILTNSVGILISIIFGMILGAALMALWMKHRQHYNLFSPIPILQLDNFSAKIIECIAHKITDYDTIRSLGIALEINVYYIYAIQSDNSRIWDVSFKVLHEWCQKQDGGLHPGSHGMAKLKTALRSINKAGWLRDIEALEQENR